MTRRDAGRPGRGVGDVSDTSPTRPESCPLGTELESLYEDLVHPERAPRPTPTGIDGLDLALDGGTIPGDLWYLGAHSSVGKTLLALQIARFRAERGEGVLVVSQEMTLRALTRRVVVQAAQIPPAALKRYDVTAAQARRLRDLITQWADLPLFLTQAARSVTAVADLVDHWPYATPLGLVVVDYLQLTQAPREITGYERVAYVSQALKELAVRAGCVALVVSATTPPANASVDEATTLFSLRGGRGPTFDADLITMLHRKAGATTATLTVEKARDGRVTTVNLQFDPDWLRFEEAL